MNKLMFVLGVSSPRILKNMATFEGSTNLKPTLNVDLEAI
jgi:hypothetical protein